MATVTVNVQANTSDATQDINNLDKALDGAANEAEKLNNALEAQENRIKTLGGAINVVGGSVEVLAGGLALTGGLTEEQAERFESAAIGAIAFADGTKRVFEGVKELNEGLKNYGGIAGIAAKATGRLNAIIRANPYIAAATALAAVTAAVYAFIKANDESNESQKSANELAKEQLQVIKGVRAEKLSQAADLERVTAIAKLYNRTLEEQYQFEIDNYKEQTKFFEEKLRREQNALKVSDEQVEKYRELVRQGREATKEAEERLAVYQEGVKKTAEEADKLDGKEVVINIKPKIVVPEGNDEPPTLADWFRQQTEMDPPEIRPVIKPEMDEATFDDIEITLLDRLYVMQGAIQDFYTSELGRGISQNLDAATELTDALVAVTDDGSKEAFEASKKYKIADVVTSSTKAAFDAFAAAQSYGPILGPILGAAQVAAIAVTANRAIQDIRSSTFDSSSVSGGGTPGAVTAPGGFTPQGLGGGQQTIVTGIPTPESTPIRAYVVTGDVTDGQQAEAQLASRRTFGPG